MDFTRPPTAKERLKLAARLARLDNPEHLDRIDRVYKLMPGELPPTGLVIRTGFSYRGTGVDADASDRKAPPHDLRPPATRLITSRGAALRFAVTLLAAAQSNRKLGHKARLSELGIAIGGDSRTLGWADLLAADSSDSNLGGVYVTSRDKRARSVRNALSALAKAGLVSVPGIAGTRNRFEDFVLLNELGTDVLGEAEEYRVPRRTEETFTIASGFVANGWLHVLEDSEIALLLMVACGKGSFPDSGLLVVPADIRLKNYGIHRDAYSSARKTLEWFGLLDVEEVGRHEDGRAENSELRVHRLGLVAGGFDRPAAQTVIDTLTIQISRS